MRRKLLLHFAFAFFFSQLFAQPASLPPFLRDSLDAYVTRSLKAWNIPGAAVGVVKDGKLVLAKGYGVRELGKNDPVDANTLFFIGSNTKAFTGTALALLENEGKCALEDKVKKWLPAFDMKDNWVENEVNLQDIVSHRMGLETFQGDFMYWTSDLTDKQVLEKFGKLSPLYPFRTKWGYTNAGFLVAGFCIEKIGGKSWADFMRERFFQPLGMSRSLALSKEMTGAVNAAHAHTFDANGKLVSIPYCDIDNLAPAGSIASSIEDMSHWLIAQLDSGRYAGRQVLPWSVIQRSREPLSIEGRIPTTKFGIKRHYGLYGMGWEMSDYDGKEVISHTGGVNGFVTSVTLLPEERLGIVVLTNTDMNGFYQSLKREIMDAYLGLSYKNYSQLNLDDFRRGRSEEATAIQKMRDTIATGAKPMHPLDSYAGRYDNEAYGWMDVAKDGNALKISFQHHSKLTARLEPLGGNRFLATYSDPVYGVKSVRFNVENGQVRSFILRVADFVEFTTYEFLKRG